MNKMIIDGPEVDSLIHLYNKYKPGVIVLVAKDSQSFFFISDYNERDVAEVLAGISSFIMGTPRLSWIKNVTIHN